DGLRHGEQPVRFPLLERNGVPGFREPVLHRSRHAGHPLSALRSDALLRPAPHHDRASLGGASIMTTLRTAASAAALLHRSRGAACSRALLALALLLAGAGTVFADVPVPVPQPQRGRSDAERSGFHDAANIRTVYWNFGMVGDYPPDPGNVDLS